MSATLEDSETSVNQPSPLSEPNWIEAKGEDSESPDSLVVFVVAKLGPNSSGQHYPVAVIRRDGGRDVMDSIQGEAVLGALQRTIAIFSDPANHLGVQSELSLAAQFYQNHNNALSQTELSNTPYWGRRALTAASECERGLREFPFISTCLKLGLVLDWDRGFGFGLAPGAAPLGTVFRDTNLEYAMAVIDISDLSAIRYGIFAFRTTLMIHVPETYKDPDDFWSSGDWGLVGERELKLEANRTRQPLSAASYMAKFQYADRFPFDPCDELIYELGQLELIEPSATDRMWPRDALEAVSPLMSPCTEDAALIALISSLMGTETLDTSEALIHQLTETAHSKTVLRHHLQQQSEHIGHLLSTSQLLGIAFYNEQHLNLAPFPNLSAVAIAAALKTMTAPPTSISLTIDTLLDPPTTIITALTAHPTLKSLYLLQQPTRTTDNPSRAFFLALASHPANPLAQFTTLHIAGAYSARLRNQPFLPPFSSSLLLPAPLHSQYPVHHLFVRASTRRDGPAPVSLHLDLRDALFRPERIVTGFLAYLRSLLTSVHTGTRCEPESVYGFACAPAGLGIDPHGNRGGWKGGREIGLVPVPVPVPVSGGDNGGHLPVVGELVESCWCVVVDRGVWVDMEKTGLGGGRGLETTYVRYAFVRVVKVGGIKVGGALVKGERRVVEEGDVEVVGVEGFLKATAPGVDLGLARLRVNGLVKEMEERPQQGKLPKGIEKLAVFAEDEAREMLAHFLAVNEPQD